MNIKRIGNERGVALVLALVISLAVMAMVSIGFLLFMLVTSDPFDRLLPAAAEGRDLNPLLQDPGMVFHPPMLYIGYVGLSAAFSYAAAALITMEADSGWARAARRGRPRHRPPDLRGQPGRVPGHLDQRRDPEPAGQLDRDRPVGPAPLQHPFQPDTAALRERP